MYLYYLLLNPNVHTENTHIAPADLVDGRYVQHPHCAEDITADSGLHTIKRDVQ